MVACCDVMRCAVRRTELVVSHLSFFVRLSTYSNSKAESGDILTAARGEVTCQIPETTMRPR
jgi:hypothetical protein